MTSNVPLYSFMVDLTHESCHAMSRGGVPEQQRHPTFSLPALGGAPAALGGFGLAKAVDAVSGRMVAS